MIQPRLEGQSNLLPNWRALAMMLAGLVLVVSLTACIGGDNQTEEEQTAATTTETESETTTEMDSADEADLMLDAETESSGDIDQDLTDLDAMLDETDPDADFDDSGLEEDELEN